MEKRQRIFTPTEIAAKAKRMGTHSVGKGNVSVLERITTNVQNKNINKQPKGNLDEQIFQDVYSAEALVLEVAQQFISAPLPHENEKYERLLKLRDLGFSNAEQVKEIIDLENKRSEQKQLIAAIKEYQQIYPMNRFIDKDGVEAICKKYGLLLTGADKYKADIPEKNQIDIVNFRVKEKHFREAKEIRGFGFSNWSNFSQEGFLFPEFIKPRRIGSQLYNLFNDNVMATGVALMAQKETAFIPGKDLCIIAPEHKLITTGNLKHGHILLNDPIILQPVHFGYLIVTSWGFEANDAAVTNAAHN